MGFRPRYPEYSNVDNWHKKNIYQLITADLVYALINWEESPESIIEVNLAIAL